MKKFTAIIIAAMLALASFSMVACDGDWLGGISGDVSGDASGDISGDVSDDISGDLSGDVEDKITIEFIVNGELYKTQELKDGKFEMPAKPDEEGYYFDGWFLDNGVWEVPFDSDAQVVASVKIYAKMTAVTAKVVYDSQKSELENGAILQAAIDGAQEGSVIVVEEGVYDVTHNGSGTDGDYDRNLLISNDGVRIIGLGEVVIKSAYTSGVENAQQTLTVNANDVTIENLIVYPVENYTGRSKTLAVIGGDNVTVKGCTVYGAIYIGSPSTGKYTVVNNTVKTYEEMQNTSINIANGAGSAMQDGERCVIENNNCEGAILMLGVRDNGWDVNELTVIPEIKNNTFGCVYKQERDCYLLIGADVENSVAQTTIEFILSNNTFTGKSGEFACYEFEFYGTYYSYYY